MNIVSTDNIDLIPKWILTSYDDALKLANELQIKENQQINEKNKKTILDLKKYIKEKEIERAVDDIVKFKNFSSFFRSQEKQADLYRKKHKEMCQKLVDDSLINHTANERFMKELLKYDLNINDYQ